MTNNIASIQEKLKNKAKKLGTDYNFILLLYFQERFLYRLSISKYKNNFILKGGLLLSAFNINEFRPTKDIDLSGQKIRNDINILKEVFKEIIQTPINIDDGVDFQNESIETEIIKENDEYQGLRIKITGTLGKIKQKLFIDIGFGDIIIPDSEIIKYPTLLETPYIVIYGYNVETVISEKLEAICKLGILTSRMKDFYDIVFLIENKKIDTEILNEAISKIFSNRNTDKNLFKDILKKEFIDSKNDMWIQFLKRIKSKEQYSFKDVIKKIELYFIKYFD